MFRRICQICLTMMSLSSQLLISLGSSMEEEVVVVLMSGERKNIIKDVRYYCLYVVGILLNINYIGYFATWNFNYLVFL